MRLKFSDLARDILVRAGAVDFQNVEHTLAASYTCSARLYHNDTHIRHMLGAFDTFWPKQDPEVDIAVRLAVLFHDVVYPIGAGELRLSPESASSTYAFNFHVFPCLEDRVMAAVCFAVSSTKDFANGSPPVSRDSDEQGRVLITQVAQIVRDLDLVSLAIPQTLRSYVENSYGGQPFSFRHPFGKDTRYRAFTDQQILIARESGSTASSAEVIRGSAEFLANTFIDNRESIYFTDVAKEHFEDLARDNIRVLGDICCRGIESIEEYLRSIPSTVDL